MEKPHVYATARQVEDFVVQTHQTAGKMLAFPEALRLLERQGALSNEPPQNPLYCENMSPQQFNDFILNLPFDATQIMEHDPVTSRTSSMIEEAGMFPFEKDVFCFKHMPYMDETPHFHDYFEITYIYSGSCKLLFNGESFILAEGEMCIVPPGVPHNHPLEPEDLVLGIVVRKSTFDSIFGSLLTNDDLVSTFFRNALYGGEQNNYLRLKTERLPRIEKLIHQLASEAGRYDCYANACCVSLLNLLLAETLRQYSDTLTFYRMESLAGRHGDFAVILQYIQQNFRTVTLSSLAEAFHYSESYLCKLIQRHLHQSFTETVRSLKMARAAEYLTRTPLKIFEIADLVGFDSVDHFSRTFHAYYKLSPREFRKR